MISWQLDQMAAQMAVWFLSRVAKKVEGADASTLEQLIKYFEHMENYLVKVGNEEQLQVSCVAKSWLPGATEGDKVVCAFRFNGMYAGFDVYVMVPSDHSLILQVETDFQGEVTGQPADFVLFGAVAGQVLSDPGCTVDTELPTVVLSK